MTAVTVLGLGAMGSALAGAFLAAGHEVTVWNRTPGKAGALVARGAVEAPSAAGAVDGAGLVVVCVVDYGASHALLEPLAGRLRGRTVANLTSDTPERSREAAAWAAEHGVRWLDGAVMVPTAVVGSADALVLFSGDEEAYAEHAAALGALGGNVPLLGADPGLAALYDQGMLGAFWSAMAGFVHAFGLVRADGVKGAEFLPYAQGIVGILPAILDGMAAEVDAGRYPGADANLVMESAGIGHIIHTSEARGLDASVLRAVKALADRAIGAGHGGDGFAAVIEVLGAGGR